MLSALKDNNDDNSHNSHSLLSAYSAKAVLSALQATALRGKYRYDPNFAGNQGREIKQPAPGLADVNARISPRSCVNLKPTR